MHEEQTPQEQRAEKMVYLDNPHAYIESSYTGRAGELLVAAHLLRSNIEAMSVGVDYGVDLEALKTIGYGNSQWGFTMQERYRLQVKTTRTDKLPLTFTKDKFKQILDLSINLAVVFWRDVKEPVIALFPPSLLYMMTSAEYPDTVPIAPVYTKDAKVLMKVFITSSGRVFVRNRCNEYTAMKSRFDRLEAIDREWDNIPYEYARWSTSPKTLISFPEGID